MISHPLQVDSIDPSVTVELVGNKAFNVMKMSTLGLPVPKGFVIPANVTTFEVDELYREFEIYGMKFPVSVRSSGAKSMPGMMDTILNVGANTGSFMLSESDNLGFALECQAKLIESLATCVWDAEEKPFKDIEKAANDFYIDDQISMNKKIIERYFDIWNEQICGLPFPDKVDEQLFVACCAVKESWWSERAQQYREAEGISHDGGTAVIVQEMVFGNRNDRSGTGVVFSHNPNSGKPELYGDFLPCAQGEDVVSGSKVPRSIDSMIQDPRFKLPGKQLKSYIGKLLREFKYIQDVEFTIDDGKLFILQTRNGKCSPKASIRSAISMINNGSISILEATEMVLASMPQIEDSKLRVDEALLNRLGFGIGVSDGSAVGHLACSKTYADQMKHEGKPYIFCSEITSPKDTESMRHSVGVVTSMGGRLSHAAILARSMSKPTVVGFNKMKVTTDGFHVEEDYFANGEVIKIDGSTGAVYHVVSQQQ